MKKTKILVLLLGLFTYTILFGQTGDPCSCNVAIPQNLRDEITSIHDFKYSNVDSVIFNHEFNYWKNDEWHKDKDMESGGQAYADVFSGFLNASASEGGKEEKFNSMKSDYKEHHEVKISDYIYISQKTASHEAYDKWIKCKLGCPNVNQVIILITSRIQGEVTVNLRVMDNQNPSPVDLHHIHLDNVKITKSSQLREKTKKLVPLRPYSATFQLKNPNVDGIVEINIGNYTTEPIIIPRKNGIINVKPSQPSNAEVEILKGELKENSKLWTTWGIQDADPSSVNTDKFLSMPLSTLHYHEAAWGSMYALTTELTTSTPDFYSWELGITNSLGGKSGPSGTGGAGKVAPVYKTKIILPSLKNDSSYYSLKLKGSTYCTSAGNQEGTGKKVSININGVIDTTFSYTVLNENKPENFSLSHLKPGEYRLQMDIPELSMGSAGEVFTDTNDPAIRREGNFETTLLINVTTHEISKETTPKVIPEKSYLIYYSVSAILIIGLIVFFISRRKTNT